jgi:hypothetical protein
MYTFSPSKDCLQLSFALEDAMWTNMNKDGKREGTPKEKKASLRFPCALSLRDQENKQKNWAKSQTDPLTNLEADSFVLKIR